MMDQFLNSLLQVVVILDVLGLLAYFVLGTLKRQKKVVPTPIQLPAEPGFWSRLRERLPRRIGGAGGENLDVALDNLKRVLYSYQQGLA